MYNTCGVNIKICGEKWGNMLKRHDFGQILLPINIFFGLLENYYNINKLCISPDKSKLVIVCKSNIRKDIQNIKLFTGQYIVKQVDKVKILGIYITAGLSNLPTINAIISKINSRMSVLKKICKL